MKEVTVKFNVYKYSELDAKAKENAKRQILEYVRTNEHFQEIVKNILKEAFDISDLQIFYSLSYCQGDGLNFVGNICASEQNKSALLDIMLSQDKVHFMPIERAYINLNLDTIKISHSHRYPFPEASDIEVNFTDEYRILGLPQSQIQTIQERFTAVFKEWYNKSCHAFEKFGYTYFYEMKDEEIISYNFDFYENGKIFFEHNS